MTSRLSAAAHQAPVPIEPAPIRRIVPAILPVVAQSERVRLGK
jgi:hypothetical protein